MMLGEFAQTCARDPKLFELWNRLWNLSFHLVEEVLGRVFNPFNTAGLPRDIQRGIEFNQARQELEALCKDRGIEYPDLSLKAFADQHLQYKNKSSVHTQ